MANLAARVGDQTTHGTPLTPGPGSLNVIIGSQPAWRTVVDTHTCPAATTGANDVGGVVAVGSATVFINSQMACRMLDVVVEVPGGPNPIAAGCRNVIIGP